MRPTGQVVEFDSHRGEARAADQAGPFRWAAEKETILRDGERRGPLHTAAPERSAIEVIV